MSTGTTTPVLLSVGEVAAKLRVHPQTVRALYRSGELAYQQRRPGGTVRIWESDVDEYMARTHGFASDARARTGARPATETRSARTAESRHTSAPPSHN